MNVNKLLQEYNKKKAEISILEYEIEERRLDIIEQNMGMGFDKEIVTGSRNIQSATEQQALNMIDDKEIIYMSNQIGRFKKEIEIVDKLLSILPQNKRNLIKMYYFDKIPVKEMAYKLDRNESTIHKVKRESIKKMQKLVKNT